MFETASGQRFANPAQRQRAQRHSKLHCGKEVIQVALQHTHGARAGHVVGQQLLNTRVANGHKRELGCHEKPVGQDKQGYSNRLQQQETFHSL